MGVASGDRAGWLPERRRSDGTVQAPKASTSDQRRDWRSCAYPIPENARAGSAGVTDQGDPSLAGSLQVDVQQVVDRADHIPDERIEGVAPGSETDRKAGPAWQAGRP